MRILPQRTHGSEGRNGKHGSDGGSQRREAAIGESSRCRLLEEAERRRKEREMAPIVRARRYYDGAAAGWNFQDDLAWFQRFGVVIQAPACFAMCKAVRLREVKAGMRIFTPFEVEEADCWYFWMAAGELGEIAGLLPRRLEYLAFRRGKKTGDRVHAHALAAFETKMKGILNHG